MTTIHPCFLDETSLLEQCETKFTRRGGPGGQHRNKTETAAVTTHLPTGISGEGSERRSQNQNRSVAIRRLRINLAIYVRSDVPSSSEIPETWQRRLIDGKQMISAEHWEFPTVLAVAIDKLTQVDFEMGAAARELHITTSKLSKLLRQEALVLTWVNQQREDFGMRRIR